jgi:hypothetical protein
MDDERALADLLEDILAFLHQASRHGTSPTGLPLTDWPPIPLTTCPACGHWAWVRRVRFADGHPVAHGWICRCQRGRRD